MKLLKKVFFAAFMANMTFALPPALEKFQDSLEATTSKIMFPEPDMTSPEPEMTSSEPEMTSPEPEMKSSGSAMEDAEPEQKMANPDEKIANLEQKIATLEDAVKKIQLQIPQIEVQDKKVKDQDSETFISIGDSIKTPFNNGFFPNSFNPFIPSLKITQKNIEDTKCNCKKGEIQTKVCTNGKCDCYCTSPDQNISINQGQVSVNGHGTSFNSFSSWPFPYPFGDNIKSDDNGFNISIQDSI